MTTALSAIITPSNVLTATNTQTVTNKTISGASNTLNNLNASNLASGTVSTARLASGTADITTYLRGDQTWATIKSSGAISKLQSWSIGAM
jgi:hypothetical protein